MSDQSTAAEERVTQAEFARRRGVSRATVTEYKHKGLLVMDDDGKVLVKASEERLTASLDPLRGGDRSGGAKKAAPKQRANGRFMQAKTSEVIAKAARAHLQLEREAGNLVEKEEVRQAVFTLARTAQESFIAIPDRLSSLLAAETDAARIHEMLSNEIRAVCQDLAKASRESMERME